nr:hypothetical protein [Enterococcus faecium]
MTYVRKESLKTLSMTNYTNFKFTMVPTDSQMLYKVPFGMKRQLVASRFGLCVRQGDKPNRTSTN